MVTGLALAAAGAATRRWPDRPAMRHLPTVVLLLIVVLKGTAPGGPRARSAWIEEKGRRTAALKGGD